MVLRRRHHGRVVRHAGLLDEVRGDRPREGRRRFPMVSPRRDGRGAAERGEGGAWSRSTGVTGQGLVARSRAESAGGGGVLSVSRDSPGRSPSPGGGDVMTRGRKPVPDRNLAFDLVRVTEAAALAAARCVGRGDKFEADRSAVNAMRLMFNSIDLDGIV